MKNSRNRHGRKILATFLIWMFAGSSAWATLVTWNLNPQGLEQEVGSSSVTFTVKEYYSITAYAFTLKPSGDTPLGLYYKNQGFDETGLGIVGPSDHELQSSGGMPLQYIQLDLGALFAAGKITDGKLQIGSVQSGEGFALYGSSTLGTLGTQLGTFDSSSDLVFVDVPDFGAFRYISIGATFADVLPVAFLANCSPIPEMSALFPIVGLIAAISITQLLRRRRMAKSAAGASSEV